MNKKGLLLFPAALLLASCADTNELFKGDAYVDSIFINNRYNAYPEGMKEARENSEEVTLVHGEGGYFNGSGVYDDPSDCQGMADGKSMYPEFFKNSKGGDLTWSPDIINPGVGVWSDQKALYDVAYGQTKKLSLYHDGFRSGYLSKLYNGQVRCNAWGNYSLVNLDQSGYGTIFPAELNEAEYFAFAARGGSDTEDSNLGRVTDFDINVTFYKYGDDMSALIGKTVKLDGVKLQTNFSAEFTSLVGFTFKSIGYDPRGTIGMSIDFACEDYYQGERISSNYDDGAKYHVGLMLLEVFFPDSSWN